MANGDIASARGWTTFASTQDRKQGYDNDNYGLDRAAEQANRLDVVEAAVNQPIFSVYKGTNKANMPFGSWTPVPGTWWATPELNDGFASWADGILTIKKAGVYDLQAHVQASAPNVSFDSLAVQIIRLNADGTGSADSANTLCKDELSTAAAVGSVAALGKRRLVAGDKIRSYVFQRSSQGGTNFSQDVTQGAYNLTFTAEWVRA